MRLFFVVQIFTVLLFVNSEIRLHKVIFNYNPKIIIVNMSLDDSGSQSVLNITFDRIAIALKKVFLIYLYVPEDKNDKKYVSSRFQTSVNICGNKKKLSSIATFIFDIFKKAANYEVECPATPGPLDLINITLPTDKYLPFMLTDFTFRLNLTEKDGVGKQRGLQYAWSFEINFSSRKSHEIYENFLKIKRSRLTYPTTQNSAGEINENFLIKISQKVNAIMEVAIELEELFDLDKVTDMSDIEIEKYVDDRGYNLQFLAAERGHIGAVNALINRGFEFDCEFQGKRPADLAFVNKHYEVVLNLLKSNFKFPRNFYAKTAPDELKSFVKVSLEIHEAIVKDEVEKLLEILANNTDLQYFYTVNNKSAIRAAIENKRLHLYKILLTHKIYPAPNDDMYLIIRRLRSDEKREELQEINDALSGSVLAEPIATFMKNSFFGPDCPDRVLYQNFIYNAYSQLLQIKRIEIIMNVVAAARVFKIVFDFKRETVSFVDPITKSLSNGTFNISGRICIGAKGMLDPNQYYQVLGVIAHELCHYAMLLTYDNEANPYYEKDAAGMKSFETIVQECEKEKEKEVIIGIVFEQYEKDMQHAETIVRVPQMTAHYHEDKETLNERIQTFPTLFKNYDEEVMPTMDKALPKIRRKYRTEGEKKLEKQRRLTAMISIILGLFVLASIPLGIWLKGVNYSWETLTDIQRATVNNAVISYYGVDVKFCDLYGNDSDIHRHLTHAQIKGALDGDPKELNEAVNKTLHFFIKLEWERMPVQLKYKVLSTNVSFQGSSIEINNFLSNDSQAMPFLTSSNLKNILNSSELFEVASKIENNLDFYVKRKFSDESCKRKCEVKTCNEIINEASKVHKFVLSSMAGEGKSTTMKHFAINLKSRYPQMWIQEVDLKRKIKAFEKGEKLKFESKEELIDFLAEDLINSTDFNNEVFKDLFKKNQMVFLWDGADEIFPQFKDFTLNLVKKIANFSENWQFITTREEYSNVFQSRLNITPFKLVPLNESERFEVLLKYMAISQFNFNAEDFYEALKTLQNTTDFSKVIFPSHYDETLRKSIKNSVVRSRNTLKSIEKTSLVTNPLIIRMIAEIADHDEGLEKTKGIYSIYSKFVDKKHGIAQEKGINVMKQLTKVADSEKYTYKQIHQVYALKLIFENHVKDLKVAKNFLTENFKEVTPETSIEITRFGILTVNSDGYYEFVHRTFAEFFIAQYFINNLDDFKKGNDDFTKLKLYILNSIFYLGNFEIVKSFFIDYLTYTSDESLYFYVNSNFEFPYGPYNLEFSNFYKLANASYYFTKYHNIPQNLTVFKTNKIFNYVEVYSKEILNQWRIIKKTFDKKVIKFSFELLNEYEFLFSIYRRLSKSKDLELFHEIFDAFFNRSEIQKSYFNVHQDALTKASFSRPQMNLMLLWNFTTSIFDTEGQKNLLLTRENDSITILEYMARSMNESDFQFIQNVYNDSLAPEEIKTIVDSFSVRPFIESNVVKCQNFADFLRNLYSDEPKRLITFLTSHFKSIFTTLSETNKCLKIFKNLLNETYKNDKKELSKSDYEAIGNSLDINLTSLNRENIFLVNEIFKLDVTNILINEAAFLKEKPMQELWEFLEMKLNATDLKLLLTQKNSDDCTALDRSAMNKNPNSFNFIKDIYKKHLEAAEIKEILEKLSYFQDPIFYRSIKTGNIETSQEVSKFLSKFFESDKIALRKLLKHRKGYQTIASNDTINDECVKIFLKLLRQTYRDDEEELYQSDLEALRSEIRDLNKKLYKHRQVIS